MPISRANSTDLFQNELILNRRINKAAIQIEMNSRKLVILFMHI